MARLSAKKEKELIDKGYDLGFVSRTRAIGGLYFGERVIEKGNNFSSVLHFYKFCDEVNPLWLASIMGIAGTIATLDLATADRNEVLRNINRSMNELRDRAGSERHQTDRNDASSEADELERFAFSISQFGEIVKLAHLRIYISENTQEELEKKIGDIKNDLENKNHGLVIHLFRTKPEWESLFVSYDRQIEMKGIHAGEPLPATSVGGGIPFHHQSLKDPRGISLGVTRTDGAFILDIFHTTPTRKSFNGFVLGKMGFGKSTILKQIEEGSYASDTFIRGFDKARDFYNLIQSQNGLIIDLSGGNGEIINPLEIFSTATDPTGRIVDEYGSFMQHISKVATIFQFLYPSLTNETIVEFKKYLREFYICFGSLKPDYNKNKRAVKVTTLRPEEYPIMSQFCEFLSNYQLKEATSRAKQSLETLVLYVSEMVNQYGPLFDGHTTMSNLEEEPILFFDIDGLSQLDQEVYKAQLFSALTIIWSHGLKNGRKMKTLLEAEKIKRSEVKNFLVLLDEAHNIINSENLDAVKYITNFQREMRKFSAGVLFATQTPAEILPESANSSAIDEVKKVFSLCQYKFFFNLDNSMLGQMREVLGDTISTTEFQSLPRLREGEALVQVAPNETYTVQFTPSNDQLKRFAGGY